MEPAIIDWENLDSRCVRDELFEGFNAPKWVDFNTGDTKVDDDSWFCRPDCDHPKTAEDFLKMPLTSPTNSKDFHQRDGKPKKRGILLPLSASSLSPKTRKPSSTKNNNPRRDDENQNPNITSGLDPIVKVAALTAMRKAAKENVKSSVEKPRREEVPDDPPLKSASVIPGRNLFAVKNDIFSKFSEICCEIKQMAPMIHSVETEKDSSNPTARYWNCCGGGEERRRLALFQKKQEVRSCPPTPQRIPLRPADLDTKVGMVKEEAVPVAVSGGGSGDVFCFLNPCGYFGR